MLPIEEQNQKRKELAKYSEADFKGMTVARLRELAMGVLPQINKLKKVELVKQLIEASQTERIVSIVVPDATPELLKSIHEESKELAVSVSNDLKDFVKNFYNYDFYPTVARNVKQDGTWRVEIYGEIASLGAKIVRYLDTKDGDTNGRLATSTKLRYRTFICNKLTDLVNLSIGDMHHVSCVSALNELKRHLKIQVKEMTIEKKQKQSQGVVIRKSEKETLNFQPVYDFAVNTLNSLDKLKSSDWKRVSLALAIVTGRRMAEIHLSETKFETVDRHSVMFTGQLKVKGDAERYFEDNPAYEIPVLVDSDLVVKAHEWLKENGKTLDKPQAVNARYSGDLSDIMRNFKRGLGIKHELFSYKALRSIYADVCNQIFNGSNPDNVLYLAKILGHSRGDLYKGDKLSDMLTPQSYNSDFIVTGTDCVTF